MREIVNINYGWKFIKEDVGSELAISAAGELVNLPHTWNNIDGQDGGNDYYRGTCYYVKEITTPRLNLGEQVYLEFQGVNSCAKVIVNKKILCNHDGGYSTFRVNITDVLEETNTVVVAVNNSENETVYPQMADFTFYGGIYRDVTMVIVPASHFDMDYFGGTGIMVTPEVKGTDALVAIKTYVTGTFDEVKVTIEGISTSSGTEVEIKIPNVHLWNGVKDPHLYTAKAELIVNSEVVDVITTRFGCRTFSMDPEQGFLLNGVSYPLRGVSRHQDYLHVGNALTKEMHLQDMELIAELGANTIRLAHYQHCQYFYDLCDEYGMVVWAEIPYITKHMEGGVENTISQMTELIVQNYNHPSIICWGLSNEITAGGKSDSLVENNKLLHELCHKLDATRPTVMACVFMLETDSPILDIPDILSYNLYYGWYVGECMDNDEFFDEFHEKYPNKVMGLAEYGCEAVLQWQTSNPKKGDYSEQYQALYHEHMCKMIWDRPYLWATHVWNMFDFAADARDEGGVKGRNNKGLVTFDRKTKKDAFYIYKAYLSDQPFVHLCGSRYIDRAEEETEVKVYSNQSRVAVYQNGTLIDEKEGDKVFIFRVRLEPDNEIEAKSGEVSDRIFIKKVSEPNMNYILPQQSDITNWFDDIDMQFPDGYYSIKDNMGDIMLTEAGKVLVGRIMEQRTTEKEGLAAVVEISDEMRMKMMKSMPMEALLKRAGLSAEKVLEVNQALNKIKKPE